MESWEVLGKSMGRVGVKMIASRMRVSPSLVYRWAQPPEPSPDSRLAGSGAANPLDRVSVLVKLTGDAGPVQWLCQRAGGFFVPNPVPADTANLQVLRQTQEMIQDFSGLLEAVSAALANDQFIDRVEADRVREAWEKLKAAGESFTTACEQGCYARRKA
jgi:hypothetical protein